MLNTEECIKEWLEGNTVTQKLEALLLAIEDECRSPLNGKTSAVENVLIEIHTNDRILFERLKAKGVPVLEHS